MAGTLFLSLDFIYTPAEDVDDSARRYVEELGARLVWKVRAMETVVACLELAEGGPPILLSGHLGGVEPILVYRVADYAAAVAQLRAAEVGGFHELELPQGPCASFRAPGGQRLAVYELTRPEAANKFDGRNDE